MVVYDDVEGQIVVHDAGIDRERVDRTFPDFETFGEFRLIHRVGDMHIPRIPMAEPLALQCRHFVDCIKAGQRAGHRLRGRREGRRGARGGERVARERWRTRPDPRLTMSAAMDTIPLVDLKAQYRAIGPEIEAAIGRVLERQSFINAAETRAFEEEFAAFCEAPEAIGVSNGTTAIELILNALGVGPGDEVITVSHTFMATVGAVLRTGATPVLVDVDEATWTMSPEQVARAVTPRTRAILPVHLYGNPADVPAIAAAAPGIPIVEDAAQAHGARYHGRAVGSDSAAASYSFYPGKTLGAYGDAGAVTTADPELALRLRRLRDHGRFGAKYEHASVGTNARMSEIQAAVLRTKLAHLPEWVAEPGSGSAGSTRSGWPTPRFASSGSSRGPSTPGTCSSCSTPIATGSPRSSASAGSRPASTTRSRCTASRRWPSAPHRVQGGELPVTDALAATCLSLPIYPELGDDGVDTGRRGGARRARRRACLRGRPPTGRFGSSASAAAGR